MLSLLLLFVGHLLSSYCQAFLHDSSIVIITNCQRDSIFSTLHSLYRLPQIQYFSVFISMDCKDANKTIQNRIQQEYQQRVAGFLYFPSHQYKETWSNIQSRISSHLHFVFVQLFDVFNYAFVIVIEDDLLFAEDFLLLFSETAPLLKSDKSLLCVSAYHDLGLKQFSWNPKRLKRIQGFTGLAWMLFREKWQKDLSLMWPLSPVSSGWDHWLRLYQRIHHLDCIVPEVSRCIHQNVSGSHLSHKEWQRKFGDLLFSRNESLEVESFGNLDYLEKERYNKNIQHLVTFGTVKIHPLTSKVLKDNIQVVIPCSSPSGNRYWRHWFRLLNIPWLQEIQSFYEGLVIFPQDSRFIVLLCTNSAFHKSNYENDEIGKTRLGNDSVFIIRSRENTSCSEACDRIFLGKHPCRPEWLSSIDTFSLLSSYFDCSNGLQFSERSWAP